jgi:hypothetical protein
MMPATFHDLARYDAANNALGSGQRHERGAGDRLNVLEHAGASGNLRRVNASVFEQTPFEAGVSNVEDE